MHKQRLGMLIAAGIGILGVFLPWFSVSFAGSVSGITVGDTGWLILIFFAAALAMTLIGKKQSILKGAAFWIAIVLSALSSLIAILNILDYKSEVSKSGGGLGSMISLGIGIYIVVLAGIAVILLGFILKKE